MVPEPQEHADWQWSDRRVLVTGGGGFVGWHLVHELAGLGANVTALSRHAGRLESLETTGKPRFVPVDLTQPDDVMRAVKRVEPDVVYHFASHPDGPESYEHAMTTMNTNCPTIIAAQSILSVILVCGGVNCSIGSWGTMHLSLNGE